jgi:hypothetical protein
MDSARFIGFLKKLRKDAGKPILCLTENSTFIATSIPGGRGIRGNFICGRPIDGGRRE